MDDRQHIPADHNNITTSGIDDHHLTRQPSPLGATRLHYSWSIIERGSVIIIQHASYGHNTTSLLPRTRDRERGGQRERPGEPLQARYGGHSGTSIMSPRRNHRPPVRLRDRRASPSPRPPVAISLRCFQADNPHPRVPSAAVT